LQQLKGKEWLSVSWHAALQWATLTHLLGCSQRFGQKLGYAQHVQVEYHKIYSRTSLTAVTHKNRMFFDACRQTCKYATQNKNQSHFILSASAYSRSDGLQLSV